VKDPAAKRILFELTSHSEKGSNVEKTGFYRAEVTHPHHVLTKAGFQIDNVSSKGGKARMDGKDLSERLVTGQNPASATGVGEEIVKFLTPVAVPSR